MVGRRIVRRRRVLRAAAVGGTAYAIGKHAGQAQAEDEVVYEQEQPEPGGPSDDVVEQLQQLAKLKEQGILTDEEFAEQKARLLAG